MRLEKAWGRLEKFRGHSVPETSEQKTWILNLSALPISLEEAISRLSEL